MTPLRTAFMALCTLHSALHLCHSPVQAQEQKSLADRAYKMGILQKIDSLIENKYVLAEKGKIFADEFRRRYTAGVYDSLVDAASFGKRVTADLQAITHDKHNSFRPIEASDIGEKVESNLHHPVRYYRIRMKEHTGFTKLEWIDGKIGYLELRRFNPLGEAKEMLGIAMKFLAGANAIIIDLRENAGGSGDFLSSYFLPHPTQLTGCYYREGDALQESWTSRNIEGERILDVPLFLLTSKKTFSAAEYFAYDMKVRKRATLVGDTTQGGAHDVGYFKLDGRFEMYISIGRGINPITKTNWEGTGVVPDVAVPAPAALDTAIGLARTAADEFGKKREAQLKHAIERMETHLARAEQLYQGNDAVAGKAALDSVFQIGVQLGIVSEFFVDVLAYNYYSKRSENLLFAILRKKIEIFPGSSTAYDTFASTCFDFGKKDLALENYRKVLELDPDNANARKRVNELNEKELDTR